MEKPLVIPSGIGEKMWHTLIKLLAEQENVEIQYDLVEQKGVGKDKTA